MLQYDKTGHPHLSASSSAAAASSRPTPGSLQQEPGASSSSISSSYSSSLSSSSSSSFSSSSVPDRHDPKQHQQQTAVCAACRQIITDMYLLRAVDETWHEDCLRCSSCHCCLGRIGSTLFTKDDLLLCRHDYLRLYGVSGVCSSCAKMIPAFEMVMKAGDNVYHLDCFYCAECKSRFCVGDRYYLSDNKQTILCEYDYQHQQHQQHHQVASWLSSSSPTPDGHFTGQRDGAGGGGHGGLLPSDHFPRTMSREGDPVPSSSRRSSVDSPALHDDASSGYGSPSPDTPTTGVHHHGHHGAPS